MEVKAQIFTTHVRSPTEVGKISNHQLCNWKRTKFIYRKPSNVCFNVSIILTEYYKNYRYYDMNITKNYKILPICMAKIIKIDGNILE